MSLYIEMQEDTQTFAKETLTDVKNLNELPMHSNLRKYFKSFYKPSTLDKLHSFIDWAELAKPVQTQPTLYNQIKTFEFYENTSLVAQQEAKVTCVGVSMANQKLGIGLINGSVILTELKSGVQTKKYQVDSSRTSVNCLIIDEKNIYVGCGSSLLSLAYTGAEIVKDYSFAGHSAEVLCLAQHKNEVLVSGDATGEVFIWNLDNKSNRKFTASQGTRINGTVSVVEMAANIAHMLV